MDERTKLRRENQERQGLYFRYSASLRIFGDINSLDEIARKLGLTPTRFHRKGEQRLQGDPWPHDMWLYDPPVDNTRELYEHIDALWHTLKPHKEFLLELKRTLTVDVFLGYRSDCGTAGVEVPHTSLEMFRELEIPFGLSIIVF